MDTTDNQEPIIVRELNPISESKRIDVMDILRGFALIGILLMNIEWFGRSITELGRLDMSLTGIDWAAGWLVRIFVEGKFYKLFSLLFGMGFAVMLLRAQEAERPFGAWFIRRMIILFLIGMCHMIFIWGGDIVHDYAFGGLLVLGWIFLIKKKWFRRFDNTNSFLRIGLVLLCLPSIVSIAGGLFFGSTRTVDKMTEDWERRGAVIIRADEIKLDPVLSASIIAKDKLKENDENSSEGEITQAVEGETTKNSEEPVESEMTQADEEVNEDDLSDEEIIEKRAEERFLSLHEREVEKEKEITAVTSSDYWTVTEYRLSYALEVLKYTPLMGLFMLFPIFLIGYWFIISGVLKNPKDHLILFKNLAWIGTSVGLTLSIAGLLALSHPASKTAIEIRAPADTIFYMGQYFLTAGYLGMIVLACLTERGKRILSSLAPMGRMALTNYIMHSLILTTLFYGYGMALYGEVSRGPQMLIVLAILVFQGYLSKWWLNRFKFGPLEWIWRSLTYLKIQPMRINNN